MSVETRLTNLEARVTTLEGGPTVPIVTWPAPTTPTGMATLRNAGFTHTIDWLKVSATVGNIDRLNLLHKHGFRTICGQFDNLIGHPGVDGWIIADDVGYVDKSNPSYGSDGVQHSPPEIATKAATHRSRSDLPLLIGVPHMFGYGAKSLTEAETAPYGYWSVNRGFLGNETGDQDFTIYANTVDRMTVRAYGCTDWNNPTFRGPPGKPPIRGHDPRIGMQSHNSVGPAVARAKRLTASELWPEIGCIKWGQRLHPTLYAAKPPTTPDRDPTYDELTEAMTAALTAGATGLILWAAPYLLDNPTQLETVTAAIAAVHTKATA